MSEGELISEPQEGMIGGRVAEGMNLFVLRRAGEVAFKLNQ